jgi:SAM-dependent methyltransferase
VGIDRYGLFAPVYDLLSGEAPLYRAGRLAGMRLLRPPRGGVVLDLGVGTGLNLPWLARAVGPDGLVLGIDPNASMLARARRRVAAYPPGRVRLLQADATTLDADEVRAVLAEAGRPPAVQALFASYTLSIIPGDWQAAWDRTVPLVEPGGRAAIVDVQPPQGASAALAPLAAVLPVVFGGADLARRPWRLLERDGVDVEQGVLRGGHVVVTAATLPGPSSAHADRGTSGR